VAVTGEVLNIPDVYSLEEADPVSFNPSFDNKHGYRTKSMLVVPMRNHQDENIGVIQLINSKEADERYTGNEAFEVTLETKEDFQDKVIPFKKRYESLMQSVASQAAIAIENNRMLKQIEHQFEEFVRASVTAIESRDPATSGHSFRVAAMCVRVAEAINGVEKGKFSRIIFTDTQLKEFEFAGLLHDFGKVYLDPNIFLKSKKLFEKDFNYLLLRLKYLYRSLELQYDEGKEKPSLEEKLGLIKEIMDTITELNEPKVSKENPEQIIQRILDNSDLLKAVDLGGEPIPLLTDFEITNLNIKRGSLNDEERRTIESHVDHTYAFVSKIPWPDEYRNIPEIARRHHEKLDGSGYPAGVKGKDNIPLQSRIIVIADIFDALMASDRPYKNSVPLERVLAILSEEAEQGKLDKELVSLFVECRAWEACNYQIR
jgi:HD-GYP domain-containing protein (c-di-GMP phosphodiesterase class II)